MTDTATRETSSTAAVLAGSPISVEQIRECPGRGFAGQNENMF